MKLLTHGTAYVSVVACDAASHLHSAVGGALHHYGFAGSAGTVEELELAVHSDDLWSRVKGQKRG